MLRDPMQMLPPVGRKPPSHRHQQQQQQQGAHSPNGQFFRKVAPMFRRFCVRERTKNPVPFVSGCPTHPVSIRLSTPEPFWGELIKPPARTPPQQMNRTLVCAHKHTQTYGQRASVGNRSAEKYSTHVDSTGYVPVVIHVHYTTYSHSPRSVTVLLLAGNCL